MFDPHTAPIHSEYRRQTLLEEAARDRLVATARREAAAVPAAALWQERRRVWRPALYRLGAWLVGAGERLQAAAEPRVLAA
ncbi:MAG TPA: hypothetical protein VFN74_02440 [Chloroflexota bacterium]|nr:hypothetical protein [Chloroflexota bacterium]